MPKKLTIEQAKERLFLSNHNIELLSDEYVNQRTKLKFKCHLHNHEWDSILDVVLDAKQCPIQAQEQRTKSKTLPLEEVQKRIHELHPNINIIGEYINTKTSTKCECTIHNHIFTTKPNNLLNGNGCKKCLHDKLRQKLIYSLEYVKEEVKNVNSRFEIVDKKYTGSGDDLKCKCLVCNNIVYKSWDNLKSGSGCPICNESKGEKNIKEVCDLNNYKYLWQKEFEGLVGVGNGLLSYDFYLSEYNLLVEFQGLQHEKYVKGFHKNKQAFKNQQEHDKRKREYALKNNINLLEIWYYDIENIEEILNKELNNYKKCTIL